MRSLGRALSIAVLVVPVAAAGLPVRALAKQSGGGYRTLTVPRAIAMCQTIYRDARLNVRIPGYYVPMVRAKGEGNHWAGWLYASRPMHPAATSDTGNPRIWAIWNQQHSVAGNRPRGFDATLDGVLNTRTCVLRAQYVAPVALRGALRNRLTLSLTIIQPEGHRQVFRSVGLPAPHGIVIKYSYACQTAPGRMTITVMPSIVGYSRWVPRRDVLATLHTAIARQGRGTYTYGKAGWFRLGVAIPRRCLWSIRLYA